MYNKVIIIGHLTRDVDLRYLPSGSALATLGLASNHRYKKQDGSQAEETCFVDVKLFGRAAEIANQYLRKGSKTLIEGRLNLESWVDQNGSKKSKHVIVGESMKMFNEKSDLDNNVSNENLSVQNPPQHSVSQKTLLPDEPDVKYNKSKESGSQYSNNVPLLDVSEDEIPF